VDDYSYRYRVLNPALRFQWDGAGEASAYILEVSDNPSMLNPSLAERIPNNYSGGAAFPAFSFVSSALGEGRWYWRVRPVFQDGYSGEAPPSRTASFRIERSEELAAPVPKVPGDRSFVNIAADVYFSWQAGAEAASYTLRISGAGAPDIIRTVRDSFFVCRAGDGLLNPGSYTWSVSQTDAEGNISPPSPARPFTAIDGELLQRAVFPPDDYTIASSMLLDTRFTWKTNLPFRTRFQISRNADFSSPLIDEEALTESFHGRELEEGVYYWRIYAAGPGRETAAAPRRFFVVPSLDAPFQESPSEGSRMVIFTGDASTFRWSSVPGSEYYRFGLYRNGEPLLETDVETNTFSVETENLDDGEYSWTIQALAPETIRGTRRTGLISRSSFAMRKARPVNLVFPPPGAAVDGYQAFRRAVQMRWSSAEETRNVRLVLSRNRDLSGRPLAEINRQETGITLPSLGEGVYYWTIHAETVDGFDISAREIRSFRVLPIPPLPEPKELIPRDNHEIGPAELRQSRTIVFRWNPVEGATGYIFTLSHETPGGSRELVRTGILETPSYTLENLSLLDSGGFVWTVEAVAASAPDGQSPSGIYRRGITGSSRLVLNFSLPGDTRPRNPEQMYGR
jgi:hypothetical protein